MKRNVAGRALAVLGLALSACQPTIPGNVPVELKLEKYAGNLKVIKLEKDGELLSFPYRCRRFRLTSLLSTTRKAW